VVAEIRGCGRSTGSAELRADNDEAELELRAPGSLRFRVCVRSFYDAQKAVPALFENKSVPIL